MELRALELARKLENYMRLLVHLEDLFNSQSPKANY